MKNVIGSTLQYWLVHHPTIHRFTWSPGHTLVSSPLFLALVLLSYLTLTLLSSRRAVQFPTLGPRLLKPIAAVHNLVLTLLSLAMAVGCALSAASQMPHRRWIFCFPPHQTPPTGPTFFWAHAFYLSKYLELVDTLLIILSGSLGRLTFLHVYHHATVLVMCYLWLYTSQSLLPVALVTNASVHVVMYGYYMLCAVGVRPRWKRLVTDCQIVQFVFSFVLSAVMLWYHFAGGGCSGIWGWCFNAVFNASLLALFINFHVKNYAVGDGQKQKKA